MWSNLIVALTVLVCVLYGFVGYLFLWFRSRAKELLAVSHNIELAALAISRACPPSTPEELKTSALILD